MNDKRILNIEDALTTHDLEWAKAQLSMGKIVYFTDAEYYYKLCGDVVCLKSFPAQHIQQKDWFASGTPNLETFRQGDNEQWFELEKEPEDE